MANSLNLTPAESLVLLDTVKSTGREAVKVTLMSLLAQGVVAVVQIEKKRLIGTKKIAAVRLAKPVPPDAPPHVAAMAEVVRVVESEGGGMDALAARAQKLFGAKLETFKTGHVIPALLGRGLVREEIVKTMVFFKRKTWPVTPAGQMEKNRLDRVIEDARRLPELLDTDKTQAAAIVLAAGGALLLLPELKPFYGQLAALRPPPAGGGSGSDDSSGHGGGDHGDAAAEATGFEPGSFDVANFDMDAFASLDGSMATFDSGFDSSFSDSDSGGSDGGGDGGGSGDGGGD